MVDPVKVVFILARGETTWTPVSEVCVIERSLLSFLHNHNDYADLEYVLVEDSYLSDLRNLRDSGLDVAK